MDNIEDALNVLAETTLPRLSREADRALNTKVYDDTRLVVAEARLRAALSVYEGLYAESIKMALGVI